MPPSSNEELPLNGRGRHGFDLNRAESRRRATFGTSRVGAGTSSTNEPPNRPEVIAIQRDPELSGSGSSPSSSSTGTATANTSPPINTSSANNHEKSFREGQKRRLMYLQESRQHIPKNQLQHKRQTQALNTGTHPLSQSFTANAKDRLERKVHCLDTPPPSALLPRVPSSSSEAAQDAASILQQQVQGEHEQSQREQQTTQQHQHQQSHQQPQQNQQNQQSEQAQQQQEQPQQAQRPQEHQSSPQQQSQDEIAIREDSLEVLESLSSDISAADMNRDNNNNNNNNNGAGGGYSHGDRDNMSNRNDNNRNKRRAEIDLEGPAARRPFSGNMTSGHMSGPGHMTGPGHISGIFGPPSPGAGSYAPVPSASAPQTPTHHGLIDVREEPNNGGEGQFPPFSRGSTPVPHQVSFAQPFTQPRSPGAMTMNGPAPQRGQAAPERGDRAGSVASVTSVTSRNGPPIVNPSLPNLPPDGTNWLTGRIVVVSVGAERRKWNVHEQLLSYNSPYFKRLFNPEPERESIEGSSSSPGNIAHHHQSPTATTAAASTEGGELVEEVHLPHVEPKLFALLIRWLYGTAFATSGGQKVFKFPPPQLNQITVRDYLGLYILGQTVQLPGLRNACIDVLYSYYAAETEEVRVPDMRDVQFIFENTTQAPDSQMRRLLVAHCMFHLFGVKRRGPLPPDWQEVMEPRLAVAWEGYKMLADWKWVIGENVPTMKIKARQAFHEKPRPEELLPWHKAMTAEEAGMPLVGVVKAEPVDDE